MRLERFLKLHQGGTSMGCVSVHKMTYDYKKHDYTKTYFEETSQEEIEKSEVFNEIRSKQVHHFNIVGYMSQVELCIYLNSDMT